MTTDAFALLPSVPVWVDRARRAIEGPEPEIPVGQHCTNPYGCPFMQHCWPSDTRYPVQGLGGGRKKLGELVAAGIEDIRDVPADRLSSETQLRIRRVTRKGEAEVLQGARAFVQSLPYPRFYLDFETVAPAIPVWAGTRPYETVPFQYSIQVESAPARLSDPLEFLDLSGDNPMRALAERMIHDLGGQGPVLVYTSYERRIISALAAHFGDLADALVAINERLVDLHPVTRANYYHPDMLGSWSIKAVLPTVAPDMDYAQLEGIHEGTEASLAYLEAIEPAIDAQRQAALRESLIRYCHFDTLAMVRLVWFFEGRHDEVETV